MTPTPPQLGNRPRDRRCLSQYLPAIAFPHAVQSPCPCSPARQHWMRARAPTHAWQDVHGLPCCRAGVSPARPSSPGPKPAPRADAVAQACCIPSHAQLLPREQPHGDTWRGTRVYLCTVAAAPAHSAQLQAHTRGSSPHPHLPAVQVGTHVSRAAGIRTARRGATWHRVLQHWGAGDSSRSVLGLRWKQSLQEREQVCGEVLGGAEGG